MLHSRSFLLKLGLTDLNDHTTFKLVTQLVGKKIVQVACGADFSLALTGTLIYLVYDLKQRQYAEWNSLLLMIDKGQILAFGSQEYGQVMKTLLSDAPINLLLTRSYKARQWY